MKIGKRIFVLLFTSVVFLLTLNPAGADTTYDRVCIVDAAHLYSDSELKNPDSPRMLEYWDIVKFVNVNGKSQAEMITFGGADTWWISISEVRPLYCVKEETELLVPKLAKPNDAGETVEHMGILDYLEPGELVALSVQPISGLGGYLMVETEDCQIGFVLEEVIEPVGNPGKR